MIRVYIASSEAGTVFRAVGHAGIPTKIKNAIGTESSVGSLPCCAVSLLFQLGIDFAEQIQGQSNDAFCDAGEAYLYISARSAAARLLSDFIEKGLRAAAETYPDDIMIS